MTNKLQDLITTCTPEEMFQALGKAWTIEFGETPATNSILILLCQWALETGWGKSCHCWNIGNFKSSENDGYDFVYYKCDERFTSSIAVHYLANAGIRSDGSGLPNVAHESDNSDGTVTLYFWPDHPVSRFRAFSDIDSGVSNYLVSLYSRFHLAWPAILAGDPSSFIHQLKIQNYFTADEEIYKKTEVALFNAFQNKHFTLETPPILTDEERANIEGIIAESLDISSSNADISSSSADISNKMA